MPDSTIRFSTFPRTEPPPPFASDVVGAFRAFEDKIATEKLEKGLTSNQVLQLLDDDGARR